MVRCGGKAWDLSEDAIVASGAKHDEHDERDESDERETRPLRLLCAICSAPRATTPHLMTHGVVVHLCAVHGDLNYLRRDGGQTFARRLMELWAAHGSLTFKRRAALRGHLRRVLVASTNDLPGSYAWKAQRTHAEARFAAGTEPDQVIREVRDPHRFPGHPPSLRTIRRWLAEGRWLTAASHGPSRDVVGTIIKVLDIFDTIDRKARRFWHTQDPGSVEYRRVLGLLDAP